MEQASLTSTQLLTWVIPVCICLFGASTTCVGFVLSFAQRLTRVETQKCEIIRTLESHSGTLGEIKEDVTQIRIAIAENKS